MKPAIDIEGSPLTRLTQTMRAKERPVQEPPDQRPPEKDPDPDVPPRGEPPNPTSPAEEPPVPPAEKPPFGSPTRATGRNTSMRDAGSTGGRGARKQVR